MPLVHSRASQPRVRQWKKFNGHMFPGFQSAGSGDDVNVQVHFDVFDVDCASGVSAGVDVSVDVDMLMFTL